MFQNKFRLNYDKFKQQKIQEGDIFPIMGEDNYFIEINFCGFFFSQET